MRVPLPAAVPLARMRRGLAVVLPWVLLALFAACGGGGDDPAPTPSGDGGGGSEQAPVLGAGGEDE